MNDAIDCDAVTRMRLEPQRASLRAAYFEMILTLRFEQMAEATQTEREFQEAGGAGHG
jgi:hypothetical protein